MAHTYHEGLEGYDPEQLLHDGCAECEKRAESVGAAIDALDPERFVRAWVRAGARQLVGLRNVAQAEVPLLDALAAVQIQLERRGFPIGVTPDWRF